MAGTFAYTEATNTIEVTDGTSGTPATFNDMYTADQAGTATDLLLAEAGTSGPGNSLTYAIRPTGDKALIIKCIVAAKTAEADFIFITGTDAWGAAQTESLDVTAGNGTYTTTKRFATATEFDCSDNAAGGGNQWADGTIQVTQDIWGVVWEYVADGSYKIDAQVTFGDDSTATYFQSEREVVYFEDAVYFTITANATCEIGDLNGDWAVDGSLWSVNPQANVTIMTGDATATFYLRGSYFLVREDDRLVFLTGVVDIRNSIWSHTQDYYGQQNYQSMASCTIDDYYLNTSYGIYFSTDNLTVNNLHIHHTDTGLNRYRALGITETTISDMLITAAASREISSQGVGAATGTILQDPRFNIAVPYIANDEGNYIIEQYTCNVHVTDKEGNNLQSVNVKCVETGDAGATEFSVSTAADGTIAEQTIDYKKWVGTSETLTTYSPHEFTFTKAGFEPYIIKNVTVDDPIVWEIKMTGAHGAIAKQWR